jgi:large subunit ribosomal protein L27
MGKDHTIFAVVKGNVKFHTGLKRRQYISVIPMLEAAE